MRRRTLLRWATPLAVALPGFASAQFDPSVVSALDALRERGAFSLPIQNPFQPTGFPGLPEKRPDEVVDSGPGIEWDSDTQGKEGDTVFLEGNVEVRARGYVLRCDKLSGSLRRQVFTAEGNVMLTGNGTNVVGERVTVDFINENYVAEQAETQIDPSQLQNRVTDKVYISGKLSAGTRLLTHTQDGFITTCNLERPHFGWEARDLEVRTGKRAILRDARLRILGKTVFQIPYLVIPLEDRTVRNLPYFGRTADEGYFVKNTYGVPVKGNAILITHQDYMEKLGLGLGADYGYNAPAISGVVRGYRIFGQASTTTFSNDHRQAFSWGSLSLQNDYQKDNYLTAPGQTLLTTRGALTYNDLFRERATTRFTLNRNSSSNVSSGYSTLSQTFGLSDTWQQPGGLRTDAQINYLTTSSQSSGGTSTDAERVQLRLLGSQEIGLGTAAVQYQRTIPVGETNNGAFLGGSDLTPVLSLQSDSRRLLGQAAGARLPLRTELSWGQYADPRRGDQTERTALSLAYNKTANTQDRLTLDTNANFRQGLYSDDTAQYVLGLNENVRYRLGPDTGINLRYGYLRPYGYTPLSIDSTGQTNFVSADVNVRPIRSLLLGGQTGYDLLRLKESEIAWQQVGLRSEWTPRSGILFRGLYTYDTYNQVFSQLRFDLSAYGRETRGTLNATYDGRQHTWSSFNGTLDGLRIGRTKISALFSYNGYLKRFQTKQYAFTYDLHCAEAILAVQENDYGFRPGRQIYFLLRIKALPFDLPFGTGTRGQGVGFGSGTNF